MRTALLCLLFLAASFPAGAQVWAPAGAAWHYDWVEMATDGYAKIQYVTDSVVGGRLCKILKVEKHTYNWLTHTYSDGVLGYEYTFLENDVVYYYRYGRFFTLYDFSSAPGNSWEVAGWEQNNPCDSTGSIVIDSTGMTTLNSVSLKYLRVSPGQNSEWEFMDKILERIGSLGYMFPGPNCMVDIPGPGQLRCYYDDAFGLYQRPGFPPACDYITGTGNNHGSAGDVRIYPVPASSAVTVEFARHPGGVLRVAISDISGQKIKKIDTKKTKFDIDIDDLGEGIYLITITDQDGFTWHRKIIKSLP